MLDTSRIVPLVSAATLALVMGQSAIADPQAAAAPAPEAAPAAAPSPADAARAQADERRAAMRAEREKRYEELRARALEIGLALPETPPWETVEAPPMPPMPEMPAMPGMPEMPAMPDRRGMSPEDFEAMRKERQAMREKMQSMTPEERQAAREEHWKKMRAEAAERGIELPETPPWVAAEQRRQEMQAQFEKYRQAIDSMTEEQREAARAIFGGMPPMPEAPAMPAYGPPRGYGYNPHLGYPGGGMGPGGMGPDPMMMGPGGPMPEAPPQAPAQ
jgi:hypothetical protein